MSAFDVQVKKVQDTWSTRVPWQSGTDGQLLQEFYEVYQKWGMMTLIPAFSAASHIFGQDVHKAALVDTALQEVSALRKAVKEAEIKAEETKQTPPGQDITKEMVLDKVKENQTLRLQQAQAVVQSMEAEIALVRQGQAAIEFDDALIKAREARLLCSQALTTGVVGYAEKEIQEAMHALTTATNTQSLAFLDKLLAPQQKQIGQGTPMTQAEALRLLKIAWNQLVRAVILQNGQKGVGVVKYPDTEKTPRGKQALTTLAHDEMSETINMKCMQGESIEDYTCRLQHRERYVRWAISTLLQAPEDTPVLQLADTQFFKLLKTALPQAMLFMGHANFGQGFSVLAAGILEATAGTPQTNTPKKVGFAAPALGGRLSRQPGNVINDETRVEEHNKKVTTTYRPKPPSQQDEEEQPSSEDEMEAKVRKLMAEVQQRREKKSPTKIPKPADRDDSDAASDGQQQDFDRGTQTNVLISLLKDMQGKISDNRVPAKGTSRECFAFTKTGACKFADKCKFEHSGGTSNPPSYPSSPPKRPRQDSPAPRSSRDCFSFLEGYCRKGDQCTFAHNKSINMLATGSNNRPQRPMQAQTPRDCASMKRGGVCGDRHCQDYHGKFDERSKLVCKNFQEGRPCHHLWTQAGCGYSHIPDSKQTRRPEHRHEKNGRGSGRADRYRG